MIASGAMDTKIKIICVIGPTASGKTAKAVALAKDRNGEVISVDSRQVYTTLDIGTEKISEAEMEGVPHHLISVIDPKETYSAGDFVKDATRLIEDITSRGKLPILAGGTHYYFDSLLHGIPEETPVDEAFREKVQDKPNEELFEEIEKKDPRRAGAIDPHNRRRLIRALEIIEQHGRVPERVINPRYDVEWVMMLPERENLRERIATRLQEALNRGLVEEVRKVREYLGDERLNELGLEYKIVGEYLRGERTEESLLPALSAKLYQYARRQEAWMRKLTSAVVE